MKLLSLTWVWFSGADGASDEMFRFDTLTGVWTLVRPLSPSPRSLPRGVGREDPSARYQHAMVSVGTNIYVFGGRISDGESGAIDGEKRVLSS